MFHPVRVEVTEYLKAVAASPSAVGRAAVAERRMPTRDTRPEVYGLLVSFLLSDSSAKVRSFSYKSSLKSKFFEAASPPGAPIDATGDLAAPLRDIFVMFWRD